MHILLKATSSYPGILIITHKEHPFLVQFLEQLKGKYYVIMHIGSIAGFKRDRNIALYMMSESRITNNLIDIPFCSRNFLSTDYLNDYELSDLNNLMKKKEIDLTFTKKIDYLCVGRCIEIKKTVDILNNFVNFNKKHDNKYNIVFVILAQTGTNNYYKLFLEKVKEYNTSSIILLDTHNIKSENKIFLGFSTSELSIIYRNSRVYIHGCESEGESRSIQEGLLSGNISLLKENMVGGGLDYSNKQNCVYYKNENASVCHEKALKMSYDEKLVKSNIDRMKKIVSEKYTRKRFTDLIFDKLNYRGDKVEFNKMCDTDNLAFSLPGHNLSVPWYIEGSLTADIRTPKQLEILCRHL